MNNSGNNVPVLEAIHIGKTFKDGDNLVTVLNDINFSIKSGEKVAIMGASGSGKSTLLHLLGGLDDPTTGEVVITGQKINTLSQHTLSQLRGKKLGFVYQFHHLLVL